MTNSFYWTDWKYNRKNKKHRYGLNEGQKRWVIEILKQYTSFKIWKVVSYFIKCFNIVIILHVWTASLFQFRMEFKTLIGLNEKTIIHLLMQSWPTQEKRIIAYSWLELKHRPKLKQLLTTLDDDQCEGLVDKGTLLLIQVNIMTWCSNRFSSLSIIIWIVDS